MPPKDKQERRLARQRGAGTRDLKNATFGFSIGGQPSTQPLPAQRSARRTPAPRPPSARKTPATRPRSKTPADRRSKSKTPAVEKRAKTPAERRSKTPALTEIPSSAAPRSSGRLKRPTRTLTPGQVLGKDAMTAPATKRSPRLEALMEENAGVSAEDEVEEHTGIEMVEGRLLASPALAKNVLRTPILQQGGYTVAEESVPVTVMTTDSMGGVPVAVRTADSVAGATASGPAVGSRSSVRLAGRRISNEAAQTPASRSSLPVMTPLPTAIPTEHNTMEGDAEVFDEPSPDSQATVSEPRDLTPVALETISPREARAAKRAANTPVQKATVMEVNEEEDVHKEDVHQEDVHEEDMHEDELSPQQTGSTLPLPTSPRDTRAARRGAATPAPNPTAMEIDEEEDELSPQQTTTGPSLNKGKALALSSHPKKRARDNLGPEASEEDDPEQLAKYKPRKRAKASPRPKASHPEASDPEASRPALASVDTNSRPKPPTSAKPPKTNKRASTASTKAPKRAKHAKKTKSKPSTTPSEDAEDEDDPKATIPVMVYRLATRNPAHNHARDVSQDSDNDDPLAGENPTLRIPGVNPIDVLAQIASELTLRLRNSHLRKREQHQSMSMAEIKKSRREVEAIEKFEVELKEAFFELQVAADGGRAVDARLRGVRRERVQLREELAEVRRKRNDVGVAVDAVRASYARDSGREKGRVGLAKDLWDVENAISRGKERAREEGREDEGVHDLGDAGGAGLEDSIRDVVGRVAGKGVLEEVREFNAWMEQAANVLENTEV